MPVKADLESIVIGIVMFDQSCFHSAPSCPIAEPNVTYITSRAWKSSNNEGRSFIVGNRFNSVETCMSFYGKTDLHPDGGSLLIRPVSAVTFIKSPACRCGGSRNRGRINTWS